jgi:AraC-like DNA-binding protein
MTELKTDVSTAVADFSSANETNRSTAIGSYAQAIARALEASGVDSARIFQQVGIPANLPNDPLTRLPTATITKLYRTCVEVTNNPYFGLSVAGFMQLSHFHVVGYALAASGTLMDFCRRLERYLQLVSQVANASLSEVDGKVLLRFEHLVEVSGETEDAFFGFLVQSMRQLYTPEFNPLRVEFCRSMPPEGDEPYAALFRAPMSFSQSAGLFVFDKADLLQSLPGACPEIAQASDSIVINYLTRLEKSDVITGVTLKIIEFLPDGDCTRDKVARALCMSPSTLQFKLSQRGTSFQQLLDETRKELACSYISQATRPITEITFLLGFSDTSNFTRAFKRWTGLSPSNFRQHKAGSRQWQ